MHDRFVHGGSSRRRILPGKPLPDDRHGPQEELFLFVHIPKTGGKTLRLSFREMLIEHHEFLDWRDKGFELAREANVTPFEERSVDVALHEYWRARLDESRARIAPDRVETGVCYPA